MWRFSSAIIIGFLGCSVLVHAEQQPIERPTISAMAEDAVAIETALKIARNDPKKLTKELSTALKSTEEKDNLGALRLIGVMGRTDELSDVSRLAASENESIAANAHQTLALLSGDKAGKAVLKEWERLEAKDEGAISTFADRLVERPGNITTLEGLIAKGKKSELAKATSERMLEALGIKTWDKDSKAALEFQYGEQKKPDGALPLLLPSMVEAKQRRGPNLHLEKGTVLKSHLLVGVERKERQGVKWSIWVCIETDESRIEVHMRDKDNQGISVEISPERFLPNTGGSIDSGAPGKFKGKWVEVSGAWMPFENDTIANVLFKVDGKSIFTGGSTADHWSRTAEPDVRVDMERGSALVSCGAIEVINVLSK
ncbi:MAG: hypothetical protein L6Q71_12230 [Planctomycetes bacterium]|nr:hypothetical protein [Planctomycetota bacterium]NUQ33464.1 hypothetical protein [Planctomycetaceae bacterium]